MLTRGEGIGEVWPSASDLNSEVTFYFDNFFGGGARDVGAIAHIEGDTYDHSKSLWVGYL